LGQGEAPPPNDAGPKIATGRLSDSYELCASMEALPDQSASARTPHRPTYWQSVAQMGAQVAGGLEYAHQQGVLHRDIKPSNLLLDVHGNVWITDFGLAKSAGEENLTATGDVVGTLRYLAPEAFNGQHDARSEVCALGLALYELLALQPAFDDTDRQRLIRQVTTSEPARLDRINRAIPRDLVTIVHKAIDRNPARRYQTAAQLGEDLERFLRDEPVLARRASGPERLLRWARQHSATAAALGVIGLLLVGTAVASTLAAWKFQRLADEKEAALVTALQARNDADNARDEERWERYRSNIAAASAALQLHNNETARSALEAAPLVHREWEWRHLHSQLDVSSFVVPVPGGPTSAMSLSPSGRQVAVACIDRDEAYLFDVATGKPGAILRGHEAPVTSLVYSPDGQSIATAAPDGTIRLWDPATGRQRAVLRGPPGPVELAYSPDGRRIAASMDDQNYLWDTESGGRVASLGRQGFEHGADARRLPRFSPDGRRLISGRLGELCQWDAVTGKLVAVLGRFESPFKLLASSPDGKRVTAVGAEDPPPPIHVWDADSGKVRDLLHGHRGGLRFLAFSPDGSRFLSLGRYPDCSPRLWDAATGRLVAVLTGHTNSVEDAVFSPDGRCIGTASMDTTAQLWDAQTGELIAVLGGHTGRLGWLRFSPDGRRVVTAAEDATLRLWDARTGELAAVLCGHGGHGKAFAAGPLFTPDGSFLVSASPDGTLRLWDLKRVERNGILRGHESFVYDVAFSPDGQEVASASWDGTVRLWEAASGRPGELVSHQGSYVLSVAYRGDGRQLVTLSRPAGVTLWDRTERGWQPAWRIDEGYSHSQVYSDAVINRQGTLIAAGSGGGPVYLYHAATGKRVAVMEGHHDIAVGVAFRPDGAQLASASYDHTIRLWDTLTHQPVAVLRGHFNAVTRVDYSADGALLASGSWDRRVRFWDVATHRELAAVPMGTMVYGIAFSPDGTRLAVGCGDGAIRLVDVARRQIVAELRGHTAYVHAVAWSPDGARLVSGSGDLTVRLWDSLPVGERARVHEGAPAPGQAR
jgi:WD40 repeat protein